MDRLSDQTLRTVKGGAVLPAYDRSESRIGVVHLGPGAFFRAHQMSVYERLRATDPSWSACAIALRGPAIRDDLAPQDGLYSLTELGGERRLQVIGALSQVLSARDEPARVLDRLTAEETRLVTLTVTEKGYPVHPDGELNRNSPDVCQDLDPGSYPATAAGWVLAGLRTRRAAGRSPFVAMSCDNLPGNSSRLKAAVLAIAQARGEADLAAWIEAEAIFPDTMVDSITPAADPALHASVSERLGLIDAAPVQRESFVQWVIDDAARPALGALADAGAVFSTDVAGFERAKLRLLNGAHSSLAYLGLLAGFGTVRKAAADPRLGAFVETLMRKDLAAGLQAPEGLDAPAYIQAILGRFRNPDVNHSLRQIAADGSAKLPIRLLPLTEEAVRSGAPLHRLTVPVCAWMRFVARAARRGEDIDDPIAQSLLAIGERCAGDAPADVGAFLKEAGIFPESLRTSASYRSALERAYVALGADDPLNALAAL